MSCLDTDELAAERAKVFAELKNETEEREELRMCPRHFLFLDDDEVCQLCVGPERKESWR